MNRKSGWTRWTAIGLISLAGSLASEGCHKDEEEPITLSKACDLLNQAETAFDQRCQGVPPLSSESNAVMSGRYRQYCVENSRLPGVRRSAEHIKACADAYVQRACVNAIEPIECKVPGTLDVNAPCFVDAQCQSFLCSSMRDTSGSQCGVCMRRVPEGGECFGNVCELGTSCNSDSALCRRDLDEGEPCGQLGGSFCKPHLVCNVDGMCTMPGLDGTKCRTWAQCEHGLYCLCDNDQVSCEMGSCVPTKKEGEGCIDRGHCDFGLKCVDRKCVKVQYAGPEQECDDSVIFCERGVCDTVSRKCARIINDSNPCVAGDKTAVCDFFAVCQDSTCKVPDGQVCK